MSVCRRCSLVLAVVLALAACHDRPSPRHRLLAQSGASVHRLLRFPDVVQPGDREELARRGTRLLLRRGGGWWLAVGSPASFEGIVGRWGVVALHVPKAPEKLSPRLRQRLAASAAGEELELWVMVSSVLEQQRTLALLEPLAVDAAVRRAGFAPIYQLRAASVLEVAALDAVRYVDLPPGPAVPLLDQSRVAIGVDALHAIDLSHTPPGYGLAGKGTVGAIWDPHGVEPTHGDLKDNLLRHPDPQDAPSLSHGTGVAGCMAGSGARSAAAPDHPWQPFQLRGIAPQAGLAMYITSDEKDDTGSPTTFIDQYLEARNTHGADVVSFSFSHTGHATYDSATANLDFIIQRASPSLPEPVPIAVASGNEAWKYGYGSVTSLASGKNVLAVGASDWANGAIVSFSSFGPTEDGRIKPEVVAPGCASHGDTQVGLDRVRLIPTQGPVVEWTFDADAEGWSVVRHMGSPTVAGGVLEATTTGNDPGLQSPDALGLDTTLYTKVEITMRVDRHHRAELFWQTDEGKFHGSRRKDFFVNADGQLRTYTLDLAGHAEWKDTLQRIRIDPITTGIALTAPNDSYSTSCGTSMSTPIAAGGVLLLVQAWREAMPGEPRPSPAMLRALLVATARDMVGQGPGGNPDLNGAPTPYQAGPDNATGYGEIQIGRAVELIGLAKIGTRGFLAGSVPYTGRKVNLRLRLREAMSGPLSVTLAWDDPPGEPGSTVVLQNDLDLTVVTPASELLLPWVLDPKHPHAGASTGVDRNNNLEQVAIASPIAGDYLVTITGHELAQGPQRFALVLSTAAALDRLALDADGDGSFADTDCDDADYTVHPGATEVVDNGKDDDCDPLTPDSPVPTDSGPGVQDGGLADSGGKDGGFQVAGGGGCAVGDANSVARIPVLLLLLLLLFFGILISRRCAHSAARPNEKNEKEVGGCL